MALDDATIVRNLCREAARAVNPVIPGGSLVVILSRGYVRAIERHPDGGVVAMHDLDAPISPALGHLIGDFSTAALAKRTQDGAEIVALISSGVRDLSVLVDPLRQLCSLCLVGGDEPSRALVVLQLQPEWTH